ncbi:MAG: sigma-70 family RNA polymerase sigma factor, partial [candidate division Zixibacteria bacterium]|nr:sigma-70 family RNA polymerase sigma factor [candidate division Zixibacteria bacterium]
AFVGNSDDAYDLSQEAFIRAYRALKRYDGKHSFRSWFFAILSNLCKNALRSSKVRRKFMISDAAVIIEEVPAQGGPVEEYRGKVIKKLIWDALGTLDDDAREIIILKHFQDMSYQEIAEIMKIPVGTVMSRIHYARLRLKKQIEVMNK